MKVKLIIINWLFAWTLLCYNGDNSIIAVMVACYFGFASWLLAIHKKTVDKEMKRFNNWIDRIIINSND